MDGYDSILSLKMRTFWVGVIECELGWGVFLLYSWRAAHARYRSRGQRVETTGTYVRRIGCAEGQVPSTPSILFVSFTLMEKGSNCRLCNLHFTCCCGEFFMWECWHCFSSHCYIWYWGNKIIVVWKIKEEIISWWKVIDFLLIIWNMLNNCYLYHKILICYLLK